jgi:hypothetical protein
MKGIELLVAGRSVKTVAAEVGRSQPGAFVELFRQTLGMSPRTWVAALEAPDKRTRWNKPLVTREDLFPRTSFLDNFLIGGAGCRGGVDFQRCLWSTPSPFQGHITTAQRRHPLPQNHWSEGRSAILNTTPQPGNGDPGTEHPVSPPA